MAFTNLDIVRPGSTLYIPWHTFDSNDPSASVTISGLALADILIYKNGNTTERGSTAGFSLLDTDGIDFDTKVGIHAISIDLSDNTTANFYEAGAQYWVVIDTITVDGASVRFVLATFTIGYPNSLLNTTIATLASQTSFTLSTGPADDDALNGSILIIHDLASAVQMKYGVVQDYTGSTKTVTLVSDLASGFVAAAGDNISVLLPAMTPTVMGRTLDLTAGGAAGIDLANVENQSTSLNLSSTTINLVNTATTVTNDVGINEWNGVALATTNPLPNAAAGAAGGLPTDSAGKTSFNDLSAAQVNTEVDNAIVTYGLDHLVTTAVVGADVTDDSIIAKMVSKSATADWDSFVNTTDALEAIADASPPTAAAIADAVWDEAQSAHIGLGTFGYIASEIDQILTDTADIQPKLGTITDLGGGTTVGANLSDMAGATFSTATDSQEAIRDHIGDGTNLTEAGGSGDHLTAIPWNSAWDAQVESEVNDALVVLGLDHLISTSVAGIDVADNSIIAKMVSKSATADWDSFVNTTDALEAIADASTPPTAAAIADAVWDEAQGDHVGAGSFGEIATEMASVLADTADMQPKLGTISNLGGGATVGANLSDMAGATFASSTDSLEALRNRGDAAWITAVGFSTHTAAAVADAVWDELQAEHVTAGSFGVIATEIADILTDTADIQPKLGTISNLGGGATVGANLSDMAGATFSTATDSQEAIRDHIGDGTNLTEAGGSGDHLTAIPWNSVWDAEVESEVSDALVAIGLDHLVSATVTGTDIVDNSIIARLVSKSATADWDSYVNTTDSLEAIADASTPPTAATIADAVWDELQAEHVGAGTFGEIATEMASVLADTADMQPKLGTVTDLGGGATFGANLSDMAGATFATSTDSLEALRNRGDAAWITAVGFSTHTAAAVADAVWDEMQTAHITAGTFGEIATEMANVLADTADMQPKLGTISNLGGGATVGANLSDMAGATFATSTDSLEAIRNRGDSAWITAVGFSTHTAAAVADAVWDELQAEHVGAGSFGVVASEVADILVDTADIQPKLGTISNLGGGATVGANLSDMAGATFSTATDSQEALRDHIGDGTNLTEAGGSGDHLTAIPWNSVWDTQVESEVSDALIAIGLDHLVSATVTGTDIADNSIIAKIVSKSAIADWDSFVNTTDSLEAISDSESTPPTAAAIADAVWDEAQGDHVGAGTFGEVATEMASVLEDTADMQPKLGTISNLGGGATVGANLSDMAGATFSTATDSQEAIRDHIGDGTNLTEAGGSGDHLTAIPWNAVWDAEVQSECADALVAYDPPTRAELTSDINIVVTDLDDIKGTAFIKDTHSLVNIEGYVDLIDDGTSGLAKIATDAAAILVDTAEIGAAGAGLSNIPWNATWDAEVQSEANDALVALGLDHLVSTSVTGVDVADNSIIALMVSKSAIADWDSFVNTTDSLEAIADSESTPPTAAAIADAVWDEVQADHTTAGSFGEIATEIAEVLTDTADIQPKLGTVSNLGTGFTVGANLSDMAGATFVGSTDSLEALRNRGDAAWITAVGFSSHSAADVADAVWDELQSAHVTAGSFGEIASEIADVLTDTADMQPKLGTVSDLGGGATVGANLSDMAGATFSSATDSQEALRDHIGDGTNLTEAGGSGDHLTAIPWNSVWDAEVESEVSDALVAIGLDHLVSATVTGTDIVDNSIIAKMVSKSATADWDSFVNTTDSLEAIADSESTPPTAEAIADAVWDEAQSAHVGAGTFGVIATEIADVLTDTADMQPKLGTISDLGGGATVGANLSDMAGATFSSATDSQEALRDHIGDGTNLTEAGGTGDHLTAIPWNSVWDAEVQSEVSDALTAMGLDHLVSAAVTGTDIVDNSIIALMVSKSAIADWDSFVNTTDSLEAIADSESTPPTAAAIADAVWDEAQSAHVGAGTFGEIATEIADVLADTADIQPKLGTVSDLGGGSTLSDNLSDMAGATFATATDSLEAIRNRGDAAWVTAVGFSTHTAAAVADAVWDELQSAHITAGTFGEIATEIGNVLADTADMQPKLGTISNLGGGATVGANLSDMAGATFSTATDSQEAIRDHIGDGTNLTEAGGSGDHLTAIPWNSVWDAEVQSEVNDALVAIGLDHLVSVSVTGTDITDNSIIAKIVSKSAIADWDSFVNTTDSLEAIADSESTPPTAEAIADAVWDEAQGDHVGAGTFGEVATEMASVLADTADMQPKLGTISNLGGGATVGANLSDMAGATFSTATDSQEALRDHIGDGTNLTEAGGTGDHLTAIPWNSVWDAEVQSEVSDALTAMGLDHLVSAAVTGTDIVDNSIIALMVSKSATADWDTFVNTTDSLEAIADSESTPPTAEAIADAVWDEAQSAHVGAGTFGEIASEIADVLADTADMQPKLGTISDLGGGATMGSNLSDMAGATFATATDSLEAIRNRGDAAWITAVGFSTHTAAAVADAVWDEMQSAHITPGTFGEIATESANILADTADMQPKLGVLSNLGSGATVGANLSDMAGATFSSATDSQEALRDHIGDGTNLTEAGGTGDHLTAIPWNSVWDAEVQSEVNDALVAMGLDHLISTSVTGTDVVDNSIIAYIVSKGATADWDTFVNTTDSLEAIADSESTPPTAEAIADAVWDEAQSAHIGAGTFGEMATEMASVLADTADMQPKLGTVSDLGSGATVAANLSDMAGATFATGTDSLEAIRNRGDAAWITAVGFSTLGTGDVANAVWNQLQASNTIAGTFGEMATEMASVLADTADMQPKLGTLSNLGSGATVGSNLLDLAGATFDTSTDSQEAIRDRGDAAWTTGAAADTGTIATAVWDKMQADHVLAGSFGEIATEMASVLADTADMQPKLGTVSDLGSGSTVGANLSDMAGATFDTGTDSLEAIRNRGDVAWITADVSNLATTAGLLAAKDEIIATGQANWVTATLDCTGDGPHAITFTINDGTDPIQGATVRGSFLTTIGIGTTDANGQVTLGLAAGTNRIIVTAAGYQTHTVNLAVSGDASVTYSLTEIVITPADSPIATTGYFTIYDVNLAVVTGVEINYRMVTHPIGLGYAHQQAWAQVTSDANGVVQMTMVKGASYQYGLTTAATEAHCIPTTAGATQQLPNIILPVTAGR